jgi:hypothetical protein
VFDVQQLALAALGPLLSLLWLNSVLLLLLLLLLHQMQQPGHLLLVPTQGQCYWISHDGN